MATTTAFEMGRYTIEVSTRPNPATGSVKNDEDYRGVFGTRFFSATGVLYDITITDTLTQNTVGTGIGSGFTNIAFNRDGWLILTRAPQPQEVKYESYREGRIYFFDSLATVDVLNLNESLRPIATFENASYTLQNHIPPSDGIGYSSFTGISVASDADLRPSIFEFRYIPPVIVGLPGGYEVRNLINAQSKTTTQEFPFATLFTAAGDTVDFNKLTQSQAAIVRKAQIYDAGDGDDVVILPDYGFTSPAGTERSFAGGPVWNNGHRFGAGAGNDKVTGGRQADLVDLGDGNDTWYGSGGNDKIDGGKGNDVFDFITTAARIGTAEGSQWIIGGGRDADNPTEKDVLKLPGSSGDYQVMPFEVLGKYTDMVTVIYDRDLDTGRQTNSIPSLTYAVKEIEKIEFEKGPTNSVTLTMNNVVVEMAQLAKEVYGPQPTLSHKAETLIGEIGADIDHYFITRPTLLRGWHGVSALELGLPAYSFNDDPALARDDFGGSKTLRFSMFAGHYQAIDPNSRFAASQASGDQPEANALVLTGIVDGKKTLAIVFRGTDQVADFDDYRNFSYHYAKFEPLLKKLPEYMKQYGIEQVLATGHSLGAGMVEYFMADSRFKSWAPKAVTFGSPGSDAPLDAGTSQRITNFVQTEDPVAGVPPLFGSDAVRKELLTQVLGAATGQQLGGLVSQFLPLIATKVRHGTDIEINSGVYSDKQMGGVVLDLAMAEHGMSLYRQNVAQLLLLSKTEASLLGSGVAGALRDYLAAPLTKNAADIQVALPEPRKNVLGFPFARTIYIDREDEYVLGGSANNEFRVTAQEQIPSFGVQRTFDGGEGRDRIILPESAASYFIETRGGNDFLMKLMPHGVPDIILGRLISIEKLRFFDGEFDFAAFKARGVPVQGNGAPGSPAPSGALGFDEPAAASALPDWYGHDFATEFAKTFTAQDLQNVTSLTGTDGKDVIDLTATSAESIWFDLEGADPVLHFEGNAVALKGIERIALKEGVVAFDAEGEGGLVYRLYQAAFAREPDEGGLSFWIRALDSRVFDALGLATNFIGSEEFGKAYAGLDGRGIVQKLYQNVLQRDGETGGINFWTGELEKGVSLEQVLIGFSESPENKALVAGEIGSGFWYA